MQRRAGPAELPAEKRAENAAAAVSRRRTVSPGGPFNMPNPSLPGALRHLRQLAAVQACRALADRDLLERFVTAHDEAAFTALLERHGPMVLGVCRRALPDRHAAEDACQATFLVLARKAASVRTNASLGGWLHGVAARVAANLKRDHARRKERERGALPPAPRGPADEVTWREVQAALDEELGRLPERYRAPLVLCYLECLTRDEAARQLGLSAGSLHGRLERGRGLLRQRLTKRGLTLAAALSAAALGEGAAPAALAPTLVVSSTRAATLLASGQSPPANVVAAHVLALAQEAVKAMSLSKLKLATAAVLCSVLVTALVGGSFTTLVSAQDAPPKRALGEYVDLNRAAGLAKAESDADFIRRVSKDLRGSDPTPAEVHFFVTSKDGSKRQKLIDLFIQERQAKQKEEAAAKARHEQLLYFADLAKREELRSRTRALLIHARVVQRLSEPARLGPLQQDFFKKLVAAREKGEVAKVTQAYLDRLIELVRANPKSEDALEAMRQIVFVYESQGKTVEAGAWRARLRELRPSAAPAPGQPARKGK
jgi:RNA polymerase sigma factor (sigma-70 family)